MLELSNLHNCCADKHDCIAYSQEVLFWKLECKIILYIVIEIMPENIEFITFLKTLFGFSGNC